MPSERLSSLSKATPLIISRGSDQAHNFLTPRCLTACWQQHFVIAKGNKDGRKKGGSSCLYQGGARRPFSQCWSKCPHRARHLGCAVLPKPFGPCAWLAEQSLWESPASWREEVRVRRVIGGPCQGMRSSLPTPPPNLRLPSPSGSACLSFEFYLTEFFSENTFGGVS